MITIFFEKPRDWIGWLIYGCSWILYRDKYVAQLVHISIYDHSTYDLHELVFDKVVTYFCKPEEVMEYKFNQSAVTAITLPNYYFDKKNLNVAGEKPFKVWDYISYFLWSLVCPYCGLRETKFPDKYWCTDLFRLCCFTMSHDRKNFHWNDGYWDLLIPITLLAQLSSLSEIDSNNFFIADYDSENKTHKV